MSNHFVLGVKTCVEEAGIGFMIAPKYHPAMKIVAPVRKKVKTVFNILGPMLNPARVPFAVVGVYNNDLGVKTCVEEVGIGFMMAPKYHPTMKIVSHVRKKLKVKIVFNILGPMLNPSQVPFAVVGVYNNDLGFISGIEDVREEILRKRRGDKLPSDTTSVLKTWWQSNHIYLLILLLIDTFSLFKSSK